MIKNLPNVLSSWSLNFKSIVYEWNSLCREPKPKYDENICSGNKFAWSTYGSLCCLICVVITNSDCLDCKLFVFVYIINCIYTVWYRYCKTINSVCICSSSQNAFMFGRVTSLNIYRELYLVVTSGLMYFLRWLHAPQFFRRFTVRWPRQWPIPWSNCITYGRSFG